MASDKRATASIQGVTNQGMSDMSHVDSDLVGTTGLQVELKETISGELFPRLIPGAGFLSTHHH